VTVIDDWGYPWIISDYVDGTPTGGGGATDKNKQLIMMLLSDSLNGWKW
jgi:hypothetical protein